MALADALDVACAAITPTRPITLEDARELHAYLKPSVPADHMLEVREDFGNALIVIVRHNYTIVYTRSLLAT